MKTSKLVLALSLVAGMSFAAAGGGYQHNSNGCGVGWQYTKKKTIFGTSTRQSTGGGSYQSFAMSSGTWGCKKHEFAENEQSAVSFAVANIDSLAVDMAEGQGEVVAGLAETMGCPSQAFTQAAQSHFGDIFNATSAEDVYVNIKKVIRQDAVLSASCQVG